MAAPLPPLPAAAATVPPFDQVGVAVLPGDDLVIRMPGILVVVAVEGAPAPAGPASAVPAGWRPAGAPEAAPAPVASDAGAVDELIALCRRVSAAGSRAPGARLHEELLAWLPGAVGVPSFALVAATDAGLAIALAGDGTAEVPDLALRMTSADADPPATGPAHVERLVDWPPAPLRLSVRRAPAGTPHRLADLEAGTVPGSGAVLSPSSAPARATSGPSPTALVRLPAPESLLRPPGSNPLPVAVAPVGVAPVGVAPVGPAPVGAAPVGAAPVSAAPVQLPVPARAVSLQDDDGAPPREPLPIVTSEQPPAALVREPVDEGSRVQGFLCSRGHLNDPRVHFCALCGIRMAERTGVFIAGLRPPLGFLVFDDGATVSLDADYLIGREPETASRVLSGESRPLSLVDQIGGVSRHHAEIRLIAWDVLLADIGSANGTLVAAQGAAGWSSLVPHQPVRLLPGMSVRIGSRQFAFESPHGGAH
jgi:hypothetical protein